MIIRKIGSRPAARVGNWVKKLDNEFLSTGSGEIDNFLGGGMEAGTVMHIYGPAGSGKTSICLACAIGAVRKGKKVLFVDTEGGFNLGRFKQIANDDMELAKKIVLLQPYSFEEQRNIVKNLGKIVNSGFDLVVIDSIVSLYRLELVGDRKETLELARELGRQMAALSKLSREREVAVLICNQVYSSFKEEEIVPVGGDSLLYWSKVVLELEKSNKAGERIATIKKHPFLREDSNIKFRITSKGVE
jgi:DNA repair protein RadB